ncbi:IS110 family transposase [Paraburkholderia sp. MM6662-R1]|uniref:IS110 family transposase n=1 Tax=Paraburkholderia sp. MM6662-R1 TaxID=2991066 RepID=UPI003D1F008B
MSLLFEQPFTAYIGIDWADTKHDICVQAAGDPSRESNRIAHRVAAIDEWANALHRRFGGPIAVALELATGPIVAALQKYDFLVLFPINPATLAKYREAFQPSGAKNDPKDAELALDLLLHHPERFGPLRPQSAAMRTLVSLVERRRQLVGDQTRLTNRLCDTLKQYYPQALEWFDDRGTVLFCDFLDRWPTLRSVKQARAATLEAFFHAHHCRSARRISARIGSIREAASLTEDLAIIGPCRLHVLALAAQLRVVLAAIVQFEHEIATVARTLPDYPLFKNLQGAGAQLAPRLLAAFGEQRERFRNADELQKYVGIAPVTQRSGKQCWVHWRLQCPKFLRQTFVEWAAQTIPRSSWAGAYYRQQRAKGSSHHIAVRALAFKWIRVLYRCWQTRTPYNETVYLDVLRKRGSLLAGKLGT